MTVHRPALSRLHPRRPIAAAVGCMLLLGACSSDPASPDTGAAPAASASTAAISAAAFTVVVSDPPIADLVRRVGGERIDVRGLVPLGADGHTYEPRPEDARALAEADLYIENGMGLNNVVTSFAMDNYPAGTRHVMLAEEIPSDEIIATDTAEEIAAHGHAHNFNAHFWPNPAYASKYVQAIAAALGQLDPAGAAEYTERANAYDFELEQMDAAFKTAIATIPEANRKLVVYHDSWSYYGRRYGLPVIGAIQPADFSEPSAAEVRDTIEQVKSAGVPAFFGSEVFPSDVLDAIAEETDAAYVADLSDDLLPGNPGDPEHSYIGMMVQNTRTIVTALGGDPGALDSVDPARR